MPFASQLFGDPRATRIEVCERLLHGGANLAARVETEFLASFPSVVDDGFHAGHATFALQGQQVVRKRDRNP